MLSPSTAWKIIRDLGPLWAFQRLLTETQLRLGMIERRLPVAEWDFDSHDWLLADAPRRSDEFKASIQKRSKFFFDPGHLPKTRDPEIHQKADRVLNGEWPYFSHTWLKVGFPPDWHLNYFDGVRFDDLSHWSRIRNRKAASDIKFVWETSRFGVVYLLVRAYATTRDQRYAEAFWRLVEDWAEKNSPNRGVNWASGQEVAVRVMAWCFALYAFLQCQSSISERVFRLVRMIEWHGKRITGFIDYALSQRNNHGVSEAVGLFTIGTLFPQLRRAAEWQRQGRELIVRQLRQQVYEDGSYIQHSFNYQRVLIDNLVWSFRLGELNGCRFPDESCEVLSRVVRFMLQFCDSRNGRMPNYGGNDGSLVLPATPCDYMDFRPSLQAAHYLLHGHFIFGKGPWSEMAQWICGASGEDVGTSGVHGDAARETACRVPTSPDSAARRSGYLKLQGRESYGMLRAARYVDRPAQADQLHFDLWWRGENIACDAGTYLYNGEPPWTNALASTTVHNTVTVDHRDQMTRAGRFLWLDWAQAESSQFQTGEFGTALEAKHDGYKKRGIVHRRVVLNTEDCWIVVDDLSGNNSRSTRLHWLLPDYEFAWEQDECRLWIQTAAGPFQCSLFVRDGAAVSLARSGKILVGLQRDSAEELQVRGWRSLYYGEKMPALSLVAECPSPTKFITVLAPADVVIAKAEESAIRLLIGKREYLLDLKKLGVIR